MTREALILVFMMFVGTVAMAVAETTDEPALQQQDLPLRATLTGRKSGSEPDIRKLPDAGANFGFAQRRVAEEQPGAARGARVVRRD